MPPTMANDTDAESAPTPEYHCRVIGCDAHFPEEEQAKRHVVEDHSFLNHIDSLVHTEMPNEAGSD